MIINEEKLGISMLKIIVILILINLIVWGVLYII